jgi:hypothetical protein
MWLYLPTSCRSALEEGASTSGSDSLFRALAPSATWKTKSQQPQSWSRTWKRNTFLPRLFGQTYEPFAAAIGVGSWISSLAATRVSRSLTPGSASEPTTHATSGLTCEESWAMLHLSGASSRTSALICDSDSTKSPETFKAWATELRRVCLQRRKSALLMAASASSSWPTPQAHDSTGGKTPEQIEAMRARTGAGVSNLNERAAAWGRNWQAPNAAAEAPNLGSNIKNGPKSLLAQAEQTTRKLWQTPAVFQGRYRRQVNQTTREEELLPAQAETVTARALQWATPTSRDWKDGSEPSAEVSTNSLLGRQAPRTMRGGLLSSLPEDWTSSRLRLNPRFVEWLMGWPEGWADPTSSTSSATASSPSRQPMPIDY